MLISLLATQRTNSRPFHDSWQSVLSTPFIPSPVRTTAFDMIQREFLTPPMHFIPAPQSPAFAFDDVNLQKQLLRRSAMPSAVMTLHKRNQFHVPSGPIKRRRRNRVTFATETEASSAPTYKLTPTLQRDLWYTPKDYAKFERDLIDTLRAVKQVNGDLTKMDPAKYSIKGLEQQLTRQSATIRKEHLWRCKRVVLGEQYYQKYWYKMIDPYYLRAVSQVYSKQAKQKAYFRAILNEQVFVRGCL